MADAQVRPLRGALAWAGVSTPPVRSAVVLGGGVLGVSTAVHLQRAGIRTALLTRGELADGASAFGHSASVFLVDGDGLIAARTDMRDDPATMRGKIARLVGIPAL